MPEIQSMTNMIALPLWAIGAALLVVIALVAVAIARAGSRQAFGFFAQVAASLLLVGVAWLYLDRLEAQDRAAQRSAIEARLSGLTAQALLPNSHLACLDGDAGEAVNESCEKALYGSPEQVAAALTYVGKRIDILRDIAEISNPNDATYARLRGPLARSIEADRYGFVAQVLQGRDGCSPQSCYAFDFVARDRLAANMSERAYDAKVLLYASGWGEKQPSAPALASSSQPQPSGRTVDINFPSAASIPPVSIMSNEPGMPGQNGMDSSVVKPDPKATEARSEPRAPTPPPQPRRAPPQKQATPKQQPAPQTAPPAADPFPQPIAPAQQTSSAPSQSAQQ